MVAMLLAAVGFVWGQLMMLESKGCCKAGWVEEQNLQARLRNAMA